jgi:hypothetical protein
MIGFEKYKKNVILYSTFTLILISFSLILCERRQIQLKEVQLEVREDLFARERSHFGSDVDLLIIVSKRSKNDFEKIYETLFVI